MAILTTQSSDTPSLDNLVDELGNPLTDELPGDIFATGEGEQPTRLPRGQVFISDGWYFIR